MKKQFGVIIILISLIGFNTHAQTAFFKPLKQVDSLWNGSTWDHYDSVRYTYSLAGKETLSLRYINNATVPDKTVSVYNTNNHKTSDTSYTWNGTSYTYLEKNTFIYDINNYQTQTITQHWDSTGNTWGNYIKNDFSYLSGVGDYMIYSFWDGTSWIPVGKSNFVWFEWGGSFGNSKPLNYVNQQLNGSVWEDYNKWVSTYDSLGNVTEDIEYTLSNNIWVQTNAYKMLLQYDVNNNITQSILQDWQDSIVGYLTYSKINFSEFIPFSSCTTNQPGAISGNTSINPGTSETYSVSPVVGATSYNWSLPSGWSGASTTNSITVITGTTGGTITVSAVYNCGTSAPSTLTVVGSSGQTSNCTPELFKDLRLGYSGSYPINFRELNGTLYFSNYDGLWKTNGTEAGTVQMETFSDLKEIEVLNNNLIFCVPSPNWQLWKSNGTTTTLIKEFPNATSSDGIFNLTPANGFVFFTVNENYVRKLWRTDGTEAGTILVKDIDPTNYSSYIPGGYFEFNNNVYFNAGTATTGQELWKSDGTEAGTTIVKDIRSGVGSGHTNYGVYAILNNELYFYANDGVQYGLWKTDGSDAGTVFVKECLWIDEISTINNVIYFSAYDIGANTGNTLYGEELWRSDGTPSGTYMVKDINPGQSGSKHNDYQLKAINSTIVFSAKDGINGVELWKTDGTDGGTMLLKNIDPDVINAQIGLSSSVEFNGYLYFSANNGTTGGELWKTDGTEAGTTLVADLYLGADGSGPFDFTVFNGNLFFRAESASAGVELWSCVSVTSSVADYYELENSISVYPNPSTGVFNIRSNSTLKDASIKVYSVYGQVVFESAQFVSAIDLSNQPAGVYFIQLKSEETSISKRVVIQ